MREILFRGKDVNSNKWRIGYFYTAVQGCVAIIGDGVDGYQVKPETVGQYTGLTDKNGKKIFEGDIVQIYDPDGLPTVVRYDDGETMFAVVIDNIFYGLGEHFTKNDLTIIGNIHDNPELIER